MIVKDVPEDVRTSLMALIENVQRADLNCVEEAIAYQQLVDEFQLSQEEVAAKVGKNRVTVANTLRLLKLPSVIREDLTAGKMSMGHARSLLSLETSADQLAVREEIIKKKLSVRDTEKRVGEVVRGKNKGTPEPKPQDANMLALEDELRREYAAPVRFVGNGARGFIQISYSSASELMRITDKLKGVQEYVTEEEPPVQEYVGDDGITYRLSEDGTQYLPIIDANGQPIDPSVYAEAQPEGNDVSPQI